MEEQAVAEVVVAALPLPLAPALVALQGLALR